MPLCHQPVVLLGPGKVGRALLTQLVERRPAMARQQGLHLAVVAVLDRSGILAAEGGPPGRRAELEDAALANLVAHKAAGGPLMALPGARAWPGRRDDGHGQIEAGLPEDPLAPLALDSAVPAPILVDASAADTGELLLAARDRGWGLALANKIPLTGDQASFERLTGGGRGARWETTVASALPVVAALQALMDQGDRVRRIRGALSGSLGFLAQGLTEGRACSALVAEAMDRGFFEPDPRSDLSGMDSARKILILARMAGRPVELSAVRRDPLYPPDWDALPLPDFLARLPRLDEVLVARSAAAGDAGRSLRYLACLDAEGLRCGLTAVPPEDPLARATPSDSILVLETERFSERPLVLSGRAGGPAATAAGLLGDVLALARDRLG